jgi:hypothetical protein
MGKISVPLLSSSVGGCCTFSARFTLMADTREVPFLFARSGKISLEGSVERETAWLVSMPAQERFWGSLFPVSTLIAPPRTRNDPSPYVPSASLRLFPFRRKVPMPSGSLPSFPFAMRRELIERAAPLYQEASLAQKGLLLDQVVAMTGSARKYAIRLLHQAPQGKRTILRPRLPLLLRICYIACMSK